MFNLQGSEIIIILLLALVVLGPEKLPDAMRKMGQMYAELRKMSTGFQNEFKAAIEEPVREIRDTANTLRDSADFTKLSTGERDEKPKSAEMAGGDPASVPVDEVPNFETPTEAPIEQVPELAENSKPAPFSGLSSAAPSPAPTTASEAPEPPATFPGMAWGASEPGYDTGPDRDQAEPADVAAADPTDHADAAARTPEATDADDGAESAT